MPKYQIIVQETVYKHYYVETDTENPDDIEQEFYEMHPNDQEDALAEVESSKYQIIEMLRVDEETDEAQTDLAAG